jgi:hypothetical protein
MYCQPQVTGLQVKYAYTQFGKNFVSLQDWSRRRTVDVKKNTLNNLVHLTPLRIPLMNPPHFQNLLAPPFSLENIYLSFGLANYIIETGEQK